MDFSFFGDWETGAGEISAGGEGYRNVWVVAEIEQGRLIPGTLAALGQARELADQIGAYVYAVLVGVRDEALAEDAIAYGADQVLVVADASVSEYEPERFVGILACLVDRYRPEILLLAATSLGNEVGPRLAQRLDTGLVSHCTRLEVDMSERLLLGTNPALGGEIYHTFTCPEGRPQMATLQPGAFPIASANRQRSVNVQQVEVELAAPAPQVTWSHLDASTDLPPVALSKARIVVSVGRGMEDREGLALVERLATALGGTVAGSRGAFDEGWISEEQIIGVGGQTIAPDLYLACGLSGDVYHYLGIQDARFVVALNRDAHAPIMKVAHLPVVGDARQVIPAMLEVLGA